MSNFRKLSFVKYDIESYISTYLKFAENGRKRIFLSPFNQFADNFLKQALKYKLSTEFYTYESDIKLSENIKTFSENITLDSIILFVPDAKSLSSKLMEYIDLENGEIIAPQTKSYYKNKPLYLISIPKSGTHLLYELANSFGYIFGGNCRGNPQGGTWYFLYSMNSHTKTTFLDFNKSSWNLYHPFIKNPALFIYRNPLDILVSEANFYHKDGKTAFWSYLNSLSFEDRLLRLIDDPWLLGSIRERMKPYIGWLNIKNVIPVSFEELVGPRGGGDEEILSRLIWSIQLKLHVPGNPKEIGRRLFKKNTPTFHKGQIGSHLDYFTDEAYRMFYNLPQDFMKEMGYDFNDIKPPPVLPKRAEEFRKRPLTVSEIDYSHTPIAIEYNFLGHNIVKYKDRFYIIPQQLGPMDLTDNKNPVLKKLKFAISLDAAKQQIILNR